MHSQLRRCLNWTQNLVGLIHIYHIILSSITFNHYPEIYDASASGVISPR